MGSQIITSDAKTTDSVPVNIISYSMAPGEVVKGSLSVVAVDHATGDAKASQQEFLIKRISEDAALVAPVIELMPTIFDEGMAGTVIAVSPEAWQLNVKISGLEEKIIKWDAYLFIETVLQ